MHRESPWQGLSWVNAGLYISLHLPVSLPGSICLSEDLFSQGLLLCAWQLFGVTSRQGVGSGCLQGCLSSLMLRSQLQSVKLLPRGGYKWSLWEFFWGAKQTRGLLANACGCLSKCQVLSVVVSGGRFPLGPMKIPITVCGGAVAESLGGALNQVNIDSSHRHAQGLVLQAPRNWSSHGECWWDGPSMAAKFTLPSTLQFHLPL